MAAPDWVARVCLLLLALGFPIAIFFAWMRELPVTTVESTQNATAVAFALIGMLVDV
jgi:hypothetical protein